MKNAECFKYQNRLHHHWEYRRFFNRSKRINLPCCLVYRIHNSLNYARLGITLKLKALSVQRNQIKRIIREAFRRHLSDLKAYDYNVVISKRPDFSKDFYRKLSQCLNLFFSNEMH